MKLRNQLVATASVLALVGQVHAQTSVPLTAGVTNIATGTGLTGGPITNTGTIAISSTGVGAQQYGDSTHVPQITINAQGQVTAAGNVSINQAVTSVGNGTGLCGGPITTTGNLSICNTTVTAATYGDSTHVAQITVNAQGQATGITSVLISGGGGNSTGCVPPGTTNAILLDSGSARTCTERREWACLWPDGNDTVYMSGVQHDAQPHCAQVGIRGQRSLQRHGWQQHHRR